MIIRIAVFGSDQMIERIHDYKDERIELIPFVYEKPEESGLLLREATGYYDVRNYFRRLSV